MTSEKKLEVDLKKLSQIFDIPISSLGDNLETTLKDLDMSYRIPSGKEKDEIVNNAGAFR